VHHDIRRNAAFFLQRIAAYLLLGGTMGVVTQILDALRRFGHPTQKSALRRQDDYLRNKVVHGRRVEGESLVATVDAAPESIEPLSEAELQGILENAALVRPFMSRFDVSVDGEWSPDNLDAAFTAWSSSPEKYGYTDKAVVEIAGAAFGQLCAERLNMRWVKITDTNGTALALQGVEKDFRAFPHFSVEKRINDYECGFVAPVFGRVW
jgi:hypothetical protein